MSLPRLVAARIVGLFTGRREDADLREELDAHLEMHVAENIRRGMTPEAARRDALIATGGVEIAREAVRGQRSLPWVETTLADLRYAYRALMRSPGFTVVAVLTLALGIGASTAMFSLVDGVLLRPLPYPEDDRLVALNTFSDGVIEPVSAADLMDWRRSTRSFSGIAAGSASRTVLTESGDPIWLSQARLTANAFEVLGVRPILGRAFLEGEDALSSPRVALLSERIWRSRFGTDSTVVGRSVVLDGFPTLVVGIAPAEMRWPIAADVWLTQRFSEANLSQGTRGARWMEAVARLRPDASLSAARTELDGIAERLSRIDPANNAGVTIRVTPLLESMVFDVRETLFILFGAVALVLLIACANVGSLTFGRVASRDAELAVRRAIGAGPARVARQVLTESVLLAAVGGLFGLGLAAAGIETVLALSPADVPRLEDVALDGTALVFTLALTALTGVLFGLVPALHGSSTSLHERLRPLGRGSRGSNTTRSRRGLVVVQVAFAIVLMSGAGLLVRSFALVRQVDPGFRPAQVSTFGVAVPPRGRYPGSDREYTAALLEGIHRGPGVTAAAVSMGLPMSGSGFLSAFEVSGRTTEDAEPPMAEIRTASTEYFSVMDIPLIRGRLFDDGDREGSGQKIIVSAELARLYFPNENPIGKRIEAGWRMGGRRFGGEIVGVVGDVRVALNRGPSAHIYMPFEQWPLNEYDVVIRSNADPDLVLETARAVLRRLDADTPMSNPRTLDAIVDASLGSRRFHTTLLMAFALTALALASIGVYGVVAYSVQQRRSEIGVRLALGASRERVIGMVLGQALTLVGVGVLVGGSAALFLTGLLEALLFQVGTRDPLTFAAAPALLILIAVGSCLLPARRAALVDPLEAIRTD